ncbi:hypothetical protein GCM10011502_30210 [Oceanisphaera marina]|uniref:DUF4199 domain-containing protein n=1 Tax=Oceanisphaera marina TaxID=2017550 RepID=A0ABQ1J1R9_9GAMM|nr:hypothetical protein GCM10011502_30210 [Oceanisphaera marina]
MSSYTVRQKIILALALLTTVVVVPALLFYEHEQIAFNFTMVGYIILFMFVIELKQERVMKGISIILFGVFFGVYYVDFFTAMIGKDSVNVELAHNLNILSNLAIFSCAGAGGSVIATHADKTSTDRENPVISETVIDRTQDIRILTEHTLKLHKKVNAIVSIGIILVIAMLVIVLNK